MFIKKTSLLLAASLALAGCSSISLESPSDQFPGAYMTPTQAQQTLAKKEACCTDFSQLTFQEINDDEPLFIPITKDSQVYQFPSGKSFVQAYKLTSGGNKLKLEISALIGESVLVPQIMLLDADFNITRTINSDKFAYTEARLLTGDALDTEITIYRSEKDNSKNETYLLFYTTDQAKTGTTTIIHPAKSFAKAHGNAIPEIDDPIIPHSAMGLVKLKVEKIGTSGDNANAYIPEVVTSQDNAINETQYNQAIVDAVDANQLDKAMKIVEDAEAAGYFRAREVFIEAIKD